jgi:hypothetical protein
VVRKALFFRLEPQMSALHRNYVAASKATRTLSTVSPQIEHDVYIVSCAIRLHCPFISCSFAPLRRPVYCTKTRFGSCEA